MQVVGHWHLGFYACLAWTGSDVILSTASIMHLCAIALHRYRGIAQPLRMRSTSEGRRVAALVAPAWSIAVALSVPYVVQAMFDRSHVLAPLVVGGVAGQPPLSCGIFNRTFAIYSSLVSFFIPLAVMIVADFRSVQILRKNIRFPMAVAVQAARPRSRLQDCDGADVVDDGDNGAGMETPCSTVRRITSTDVPSTVSVTSPEVCGTRAAMPDDVQRRPEVVDSSANSPGADAISALVGSGQDLARPAIVAAAAQTSPPSSQPSFVYRGRKRSKSMVYLDMLASCGRSSKVNCRERRAEKTLIWVFAAFVALWLPFFCANLAYGACGVFDGRCDVPPDLFAAFTWLGYMSSGVNPCIYTLLNRDFRAAFRHLLMCRPSRLRAAANASTLAATMRANSIRFARPPSVNGSRRERRAGPAADVVDDGSISVLDASKQIVSRF